MTLKELAQKYLNEIGDNLSFEKAEDIANQINGLVYSKTNVKMSQTDKEIIFKYIHQGIIERKMSVTAFISDSQNSKSRNATTHLLDLIKQIKLGNSK